MDLVSRRTRGEFQEYLVSWTLREISKIFDQYDVSHTTLPDAQLPSGQRRALVEGYYASIDWTNSRDVAIILQVFSEILVEAGNRIERASMHHWTGDEEADREHHIRKKLISNLERDGYTFDGTNISYKGVFVVELKHDAADLLDQGHFNEYVERIKSSIENDPALAIGSTKELVESVLKTILSSIGLGFEEADDVPRLLKKAQKALQLAPDDIDNAARGADIIKVLLSNLGQVAIKLAELRNLYGTGHGAAQKRRGLEPRHAKLAVSAGIALSTFLLDTYKSRLGK